MEKTLGERRVRTDFNVNDVSLVGELKGNYAKLIDDLEVMRSKPGEEIAREKARLISIAQTKTEDAAHWAVKAATFK